MKNNKKKALIILLSILIAALTIYICYKLIPLLISLKDPIKQENFKNYIKSMGWKGWLAVLAIQILQIFMIYLL